jgi:hypothetical protein
VVEGERRISGSGSEGGALELQPDPISKRRGARR